MNHNKRGEIATLLTLGLVLVGTFIVLGTSLFVSNKKTNLALSSKAETQCAWGDWDCATANCPQGDINCSCGKMGKSFCSPGNCQAESGSSNVCVPNKWDGKGGWGCWGPAIQVCAPQTPPSPSPGAPSPSPGGGQNCTPGTGGFNPNGKYYCCIGTNLTLPYPHYEEMPAETDCKVAAGITVPSPTVVAALTPAPGRLGGVCLTIPGNIKYCLTANLRCENNICKEYAPIPPAATSTPLVPTVTSCPGKRCTNNPRRGYFQRNIGRITYYFTTENDCIQNVFRFEITDFLCSATPPAGTGTPTSTLTLTTPPTVVPTPFCQNINIPEIRTGIIIGLYNTSGTGNDLYIDDIINSLIQTNVRGALYGVTSIEEVRYKLVSLISEKIIQGISNGYSSLAEKLSQTPLVYIKLNIGSYSILIPTPISGAIATSRILGIVFSNSGIIYQAVNNISNTFVNSFINNICQ